MSSFTMKKFAHCTIRWSAENQLLSIIDDGKLNIQLIPIENCFSLLFKVRVTWVLWALEPRWINTGLIKAHNLYPLRLEPLVIMHTFTTIFKFSHFTVENI